MAELSDYLYTVILSIIPISELRGVLPYAFFNSIPLWQAYLIATVSNMLVIPIVWIFLSSIHKLLYRLDWYRKLFDRTIERVRKKITGKIDKFGYLGLVIFVGIPLPVTGAWTGTLGAWLLGLDKKKTFLFISLGVWLSGVIVVTLLKLGVGLNSILIKRF